LTDKSLDVLCIGNAVVDVIAAADDEFLEREGLAKGSMRLISRPAPRLKRRPEGFSSSSRPTRSAR
jgi:sugar/nucleoside kinase (ribokinase family)